MEKIVIANDTIRLEVMTLGATLRSINAFGTELSAGLETEADYSESTCYFGGIIGRTANRTGSVHMLDGREYCLSLNENGVNHLHGGFSGFNRKRWSIARSAEDSVTLTCLSRDGEEGYPGNLRASVTYSLSENALLIHYRAESDAPTPVCLTNHAYFNPNGIGSGSIMGTRVTVAADRVSICDDTLRVIGSTAVSGETDLRDGKCISREYDCNFFLCGKKQISFEGRTLSFAASAEGAVRIAVYTDMPCLQFYTGNFIPDGTVLRDGKRLDKCGALCFETQFEPNFQSKGKHILRPGQIYESMTAYVFEKNPRRPLQ